MTTPPFSPKQLEFLANSTAVWNIVHGSVRTGKTIALTYAFMVAVDECPDSNIWMIGYTASTIFDNAIRLLFENPIFSAFKPFCTWHKLDRILTYKDKEIKTCGAENSSSVGRIQGQTISLIYCDEMTLYPESMIYMIDSRLSQPWSKGFASMNPSHPEHILKKWIDKGVAGDPRYYSQHYMLDDNPFVDEAYKKRIKESLNGIFYKRNYLGLWVLAEGAIYDFFDEKLHTFLRVNRSVDYWIAGIDYGTRNAFACVLIGVSTGRFDKLGKKLWVEKEYYWNSLERHRQKTNSEYVEDMLKFLGDYSPRAIYIDPSAAAFKLEMQRKGLHCVDANNDVINGINYVSDELKYGRLVIHKDCKNLIKEIQGYVWSPSSAKKGVDEPLKENDHLCVIGDTLILTDKGVAKIENMARFGDLYDCKLYNYDGREIVKDDWKNVCITRENAEIWELELEDGKILRATGDHKILTENGYIELQRLTQLDMVVVCNTKNTLDESSI